MGFELELYMRPQLKVPKAPLFAIIAPDEYEKQKKYKKLVKIGLV